MEVGQNGVPGYLVLYRVEAEIKLDFVNVTVPNPNQGVQVVQPMDQETQKSKVVMKIPAQVSTNVDKLSQITYNMLTYYPQNVHAIVIFIHSL